MKGLTGATRAVLLSVVLWAAKPVRLTTAISVQRFFRDERIHVKDADPSTLVNVWGSTW